MNLPTIEMDRNEARKAFLEYKRSVDAQHKEKRAKMLKNFEKEQLALDEQIMRGYRALSRGQQVISLKDAMQKGGLDHRWMPRLAVARADQRVAHVDLDYDGGATFVGEDTRHFWITHAHTLRRLLPEGTFPIREGAPQYNRSRWEAMVPTIPPAMRPKTLDRYYVLWEAEWSELEPPAPHDPALLRQLGGDLYAVVHVWDLTDLERAVLGGIA